VLEFARERKPTFVLLVFYFLEVIRNVLEKGENIGIKNLPKYHQNQADKKSVES
jgi:nucleoid DNA-binding protein